MILTEYDYLSYFDEERPIYSSYDFEVYSDDRIKVCFEEYKIYLHLNIYNNVHLINWMLGGTCILYLDSLNLDINNFFDIKDKIICPGSEIKFINYMNKLKKFQAFQ